MGSGGRSLSLVRTTQIHWLQHGLHEAATSVFSSLWLTKEGLENYGEWAIFCRVIVKKRNCESKIKTVRHKQNSMNSVETVAISMENDKESD